MTEEKRTQLRTTQKLHEWVVERAKRNHRSMNAEINHILEEKRQQEKGVQQKAA